MQIPYFLFWLFWAIWLMLAFRARDQKIWWLENIVVFAALPFLLRVFQQGLLSPLSIGVIFVFAIMHIAAASYLYAKTPWGNWLKRILGSRRNHYDRLVHFLYGILMVPVVTDVFQHALPPDFPRNLFIFALITSFGGLYEIGEFFAAVMLGKKKGLSFLGVQGDVWDAQKDMLMQSLGALAALLFL